MKRDRRTSPIVYSTMYPKATDDGDDAVYLTDSARAWLQQNDSPNRNAPSPQRRAEVIDAQELRQRRAARDRAERLFVKVVK
ncbi:MAG: hypothetical protein WA441_05155 [Methyloceanibacter sp.]